MTHIMIEGPIRSLPPIGELSGPGFDPSAIKAIYTTFDPAPGLHCEHCTELAEHSLSSRESGDINLCPKCLKDALDVICSLENFKGVAS